MPLTPEEEQELKQLEGDTAAPISGLTPEEEQELQQLEGEVKKPNNLAEAAYTGLKHYGTMATMGLSDIASPAAGALASSVLGGDGMDGKGFIDRYRAYRDANKAETEELTKKHPYAALAGDVAGIAAGSMLLPGGAATKVSGVPGKIIGTTGKVAKAAFGLSPKIAKAATMAKEANLLKASGSAAEAVKGVELASQAARIRRAGILGTAGRQAAAMGVLGATQSQGDLTKGEVGQVALDTGISAGIGGALGVAGPILGGAAKIAKTHTMTGGALVGGLIGAGTAAAAGADMQVIIGVAISGVGLGMFGGYAAGSPAVHNTIKLAWAGVDDFSEPALLTLKSPFVKKLQQTVETIEREAGIPAKQQIEGAFKVASDNIAKVRSRTAEEFTTIATGMQDELGTELGRLETEATKLTDGKIDIRESFAKARAIVEKHTNALTEAQQQELLGLMEKAQYEPGKDIMSTTVTHFPEGASEGVQMNKQFAGKNLTPAELKQLKIDKDVKWAPEKAMTADKRFFPEQELPTTVVTEIQRGRLPGAEKIGTPIAEAKDLRNAYRLKGKDDKTMVGVVATEIYHQLQQDIVGSLKTGDVSAKYALLKQGLRTISPKLEYLPSDPTKITPAHKDAIIAAVSDAIKTGHGDKIDSAMQYFNQVKPGLMDDWLGRMKPVLEQERALGKAAGKEGLEQAGFLKQAGVAPETLAAPEQTLANVEKLKAGVGPGEATLTEADIFSGLTTPSDKAHRYVSRLGLPERAKNMAQTEEMKNITALFRQYAPEVADAIESTGVGLSQRETVVISRAHKPTALATLQHAMETLASIGTEHVTKLLRTLADMSEETLAKFPRIGKMALLIKKQPALLKAAADDVGVRKLIFIAAQDADDLPPQVSPWKSVLYNAASRGLSALIAKDYVLQQQNEDYRTFRNEGN